MAEPVDEFTAHLWVRHDATCPVPTADALHCAHSLYLNRAIEGETLCCPIHGVVFSVEKAA